MLKGQSKVFFLNILIAFISIPFLSLTPLDVKSKALVKVDSVFLKKQKHWADSVMATMTLDEKIGQLFMVAAFSNRNETDYAHMENQIRKYNLGGVIFFQGTPLKQAQLTNRYQAASKIPLFIGLDAEWGLGMRLDDGISFPKAITVGATNDPALAEKVGYEIGRQCKRIGVNFNFSPDVDLNSNPKNPIINYRSYGESPARVSDLAIGYNKGLKRANVLGSAKHFPGHGDTEVDSHRDLPVLNHSKYTLDELDTYPFRKIIADSVSSVMIGHLYVPALEDIANMPASVSKKVVNDYLKRDMGFDGLVVTDALNMRGLLKYFPTGEAELRAFEAGNDLLLQSANVGIAIAKLKEKFADSTLNILDLDIKVNKILRAKYWAGCNHLKPIDYTNLMEDFEVIKANKLKTEIFEKAITVTQNRENLVPIKELMNVKIASLAIASPKNNDFQEYLQQNTAIETFNISTKPARVSEYAAIIDKASKADIVIVSVHETTNSDKHNFGISDGTIDIIQAISRKTKVIVSVFGNPYCMKFFENFDTVICGFEDEPEAHMAMSNIIFGVIGSAGKIPVNTLSEDAKLNSGIATKSLTRITMDLPENVGMSSMKLNKIKNIIYQSIQDKEFPGCQVLVAKNGKVVFYETFGNQKYNVIEPVTKQTVYDIASLSKVTSTVQAIMMLYDKKQIDIDKRIGYYLPEMDKTNKGNLTIKNLLLHQAGLKPFIPFWKKTKTTENTFMPEFFVDSSKTHLNVTPKLCIIPSIKDSVYKWIEESPLNVGPVKYSYSDLGLILLQRVVEKITQMPLDEYVETNFYKPLGMQFTGYNPYKKFDLSKIAPTEIDNLFRNEEIKGSVHDENAALLGGVAGHAGIFSNAWDLVKLLQMNLNKGTYAGENYFSPETIKYFTKRQSDISQRGLGWNKPSPSDGSVSEMASPSTFGHTGFTGTAAWVDPEKELIYIFLSNRVYPSASNNLIIKNKTRRRIHDAIYQAINN